MRTKLTLLQAMICGALLAFTGCATSPHTTAWEYRIVEGWTRQPERAELEKQLNEAGKAGFVIVSTATLPAEPNSYPKTVVILKRPIP